MGRVALPIRKPEESMRLLKLDLKARSDTRCENWFFTLKLHLLGHMVDGLERLEILNFCHV